MANALRANGKAPAAERCDRTHPLSPHARRARRRAEAEARQAAHEALSARERLEKACSRRGESRRERERLRAAL